MAPRLLVALACCVSLSARAQTAAVESADVSRGTSLLPGSAAFADEPTALTYNPAGLRGIGGPTLLYLHERANGRRLDGDALYAGASLGDGLGLGVSMDWVRPDAKGQARRRAGLGLGFGSEALSLGLGVGFLEGTAFGKLVTADLGVQSRPTRWLSLGALVRNLGQPTGRGTTLAREWTVGLGLRPFQERLTVGLDWVGAESFATRDSRLQYTVQAQVMSGVRLVGGVSHGFSAGTPLTFHLGLGLDLSNLGYTQAVSATGAHLNHQFVARLSAEPRSSVIPARHLAVLNLGDVGEPESSTLRTVLGLAAEDRFLRVLRFLDRAALDPQLEALVVKIEGASLGLARADEVRGGLARLRAGGKKVYAYLLNAGDAEYLIASACDAIYAPPEAMLMVDGLRSSVLFLGGTAERLGITIDVAKVGAYKNFPDTLTRASMSDEQKEALGAWLDTAERTFAERMLSGRGLTAAQWKAIIDEGLKSGARARALGEIDEVLTPHALDELLQSKHPGARVAKRYAPLDEREGRWGDADVIAVVPVLGGISGGKNGSSPGQGPTAGAESFIKAITAAAQDDSVKAIVVRVDSGGGDGLASDLMYRAVLEAKKKKPVIASMGDAAASGGYYVSMGADEIVASPTTITGSIGVFFLKPAIRPLAESFGAQQASLARGPLAGMTDLFDPWTPAQAQAAQKWVDGFYDTFITEVAASRHLTKEAVDAVARGRVWSGADAKTRGLVDHLGGFSDAIALARRRAGLTAEDVPVRIWQASESVAQSLVGAAAPGALLDLPLPSPSPQLDALTRAFGPAAWMLEAPRPRAQLEFSVDVR